MASTQLNSVKGNRTLAEIDDTGRLEAVAIEDLHFDRLYQRDLSADWVQRHGEEYTPRKAGTIICNLRKNGELWVIDGQHRTGAAQTAGHTHMLALVFDQLTPREEAGMRIAYNDRRVDNMLQRFKAQLYAGDPTAKAIAELCDQYGTRINMNAPNMSGGINCIGTIEKLWERDGGVLLTRTFEILHRAWGNVSGRAASASMLGAMAFLLEMSADEHLDTNRLVDVLQAEGVRGINGRAESHRMAVGGTGWVNTYRAMVEVYNTKLPQGRRLGLHMGARGGVGLRRR